MHKFAQSEIVAIGRKAQACYGELAGPAFQFQHVVLVPIDHQLFVFHDADSDAFRVVTGIERQADGQTVIQSSLQLARNIADLCDYHNFQLREEAATQ